MSYYRPPFKTNNKKIIITIQNILDKRGRYHLNVNDHSDDSWVASIVNKKKWEYRKDMMKKFNAVIGSDGVLFKTKEDAKKALEEYIEPCLVMKKLTGKIE